MGLLCFAEFFYYLILLIRLLIYSFKSFIHLFVYSLRKTFCTFLAKRYKFTTRYKFTKIYKFTKLFEFFKPLSCDNKCIIYIA